MVQQAGRTDKATAVPEQPGQAAGRSTGSILVNYGVLLVAVFLYIM